MAVVTEFQSKSLYDSSSHMMGYENNTERWFWIGLRTVWTHVSVDVVCAAKCCRGVYCQCGLKHCFIHYSFGFVFAKSTRTQLQNKFIRYISQKLIVHQMKYVLIPVFLLTVDFFLSQRLELVWWDLVYFSCSLVCCCTLTLSCWRSEMWVKFDILQHGMDFYIYIYIFKLTRYMIIFMPLVHCFSLVITNVDPISCSSLM